MKKHVKQAETTYFMCTKCEKMSKNDRNRPNIVSDSQNDLQSSSLGT